MLCIVIVFSSLFSGRRVDGLALLPNATTMETSTDATSSTTSTTSTTTDATSTTTISPTTTTATTGSKIFSISSVNTTKNHANPNENVIANSQEKSKYSISSEYICIYIGVVIVFLLSIVYLVLFKKPE